MLLHLDGSRHQWVAGAQRDLIVTLDDATGEHTGMFLVEKESMLSDPHRIGQTIATQGLFCLFYTDRDSHYFQAKRVPISTTKSIHGHLLGAATWSL